VEGTPWSCAVLCCCCCHLPPPTPPESALVARVCWSPGSHSFAALDLVQLQHRHCRRRAPLARSAPFPGCRTQSCFPRWWRSSRDPPGPPALESLAQDHPPSPPCCCWPSSPGRPCSYRRVVERLHQAEYRQNWERAHRSVAEAFALPPQLPGFALAVLVALPCLPSVAPVACLSRSRTHPPQGSTCQEG